MCALSLKPTGPTAPFFVFAGLLSALAAQADDVSDTAQIQALWERYDESVVAGDADGWLALWDEGGVQMPPGTEARSYDTLVATTADRWEEGGETTSMNINPIDIEIAGEWAFSRGEYNFSYPMEDEEVTVEGKFLTILRRQEDGSFKIYRDCFNMNDS